MDFKIYYEDEHNDTGKILIVGIVLLSLVVVGVLFSDNSREQIIEDIPQIDYEVAIYHHDLNTIRENILKLTMFEYKVTDKLVGAIYTYGNMFDIDYDTIVALIFIESSFNRTAVSYANCVGYMQINPQVHKWIDRELMFDTYYNIYVGTKILRIYMDMSDSIEEALIRYNGWVSGSMFGENVLNVRQRLLL